MLYGGHHADRLHAFDILYCRFRCQVRVLAVVFEIPSAFRETVDVHSRTEHDMDAARAGISSERFAVGISQFPVPGRCRSYTARIHRTFRIISHSLRAVGHAYAWNAETGNLPDIEAVYSSDIREFLFKSHFGDEFGGTLFRSFRYCRRIRFLFWPRRGNGCRRKRQCQADSCQ